MIVVEYQRHGSAYGQCLKITEIYTIQYNTKQQIVLLAQGQGAGAPHPSYEGDCCYVTQMELNHVSEAC